MNPIVVRGGEQSRFEFFGLQIADYSAGLSTASSVAVVDVGDGGSHPRAYSTRCEKAYFVISGSLRFDVDGSEIEIGSEDLLVIPLRARFSYRSIDGPARMLLVHTPPFDPDAEVIEGDGPSR